MTSIIGNSTMKKERKKKSVIYSLFSLSLSLLIIYILAKNDSRKMQTMNHYSLVIYMLVDFENVTRTIDDINKHNKNDDI